jgi:hypothetical protein
MKRSRTEERSEKQQLDAAVKEIDRELDANFLGELAPLLERARRSRDEPQQL